MDSRVTAENHPDDPFGMGTGPTYADRSFGPGTLGLRFTRQ